MVFRTIDNVNYYTKDNYITVGDNSTNIADGITSVDYKGIIIIREKVDRKKVLCISKYAFFKCNSITKVIIYAKLEAINIYAFCYCTSLEYINIPSTVTFISNYSLYFGLSDRPVDCDLTVEFNQGPRQKLFIGDQEFSGRNNVYMIYPFTISPEYNAAHPFIDVANALICAPSVFPFYSKQTTKCPISQFIPTSMKNIFTCSTNRRNISFMALSIFISLFVQSLYRNKATGITKKE